MRTFAAVALSIGMSVLPVSAQQASSNPAVGNETATPDVIVVPSGTRLPLVLHNAISTRNARPGDPIYLETTFPIVQNDKILVPAGTYVQGEITEAVRPGRVKGRGEMRIRLTSMILPNGYTVRFDAVPANAGTGGNETTDKEGQIKGDTSKGSDAGTIAKTTAAGAGIGGLATRTGTGAGIGAGAGLAAGLVTILLSRGPELEMPRGSTVEAVLDRPLSLDASKISFTDSGRATTISGPPNRAPVRSASPF